jgi:DNA end-binding protein Ku
MVGIGKLTLRQKEHLVAVRPIGDALVLEIMRFQNELVAPEDLRFPNSEEQKVRPQEIEMAEQLIGNLAEPFDPAKYHDEYEEKLQTLLRAKLKGKKLPDDDVAEKSEKTNVIDLVARLQESLASTATKKRASKKSAPASTKKTTRTKSARKRRAS